MKTYKLKHKRRRLDNYAGNGRINRKQKTQELSPEPSLGRKRRDGHCWFGHDFSFAQWCKATTWFFVVRKKWKVNALNQRAARKIVFALIFFNWTSLADRLVTICVAKMREYIENGVSLLAWLIDPTERKVYVYRQSEEVEILKIRRKFRASCLCVDSNLKEICKWKSETW